MINDPKESVYDVDVIEERYEVLCWTLDESPRIIHDSVYHRQFYSFEGIPRKVPVEILHLAGGNSVN